MKNVIIKYKLHSDSEIYKRIGMERRWVILINNMTAYLSMGGGGVNSTKHETIYHVIEQKIINFGK